MLARKSANRKSGSYGFPEGEQFSDTDAQAQGCEQKNLDHIIFLKANKFDARSKKCEQEKSSSHSSDCSSEPTLGGRKKKRTGNLSPLVRFRSSSGPKKIIGAFSHEGEQIVEANGLIRAQELSGNSARIDIVPRRRTVVRPRAVLVVP